MEAAEKPPANPTGQGSGRAATGNAQEIASPSSEALGGDAAARAALLARLAATFGGTMWAGSPTAEELHAGQQLKQTTDREDHGGAAAGDGGGDAGPATLPATGKPKSDQERLEIQMRLLLQHQQQRLRRQELILQGMDTDDIVPDEATPDTDNQQRRGRDDAPTLRNQMQETNLDQAPSAQLPPNHGQPSNHRDDTQAEAGEASTQQVEKKSLAVSWADGSPPAAGAPLADAVMNLPMPPCQADGKPPPPPPPGHWTHYSLDDVAKESDVASTTSALEFIQQLRRQSGGTASGV
eukprot:GHVT01063460.1.p1 GENE.GHVT01063460.1~~GHVT01063460.1.p1  ORF type:complete len:331 (-),score=106.77 GHVT01063460.1:870-1754(-)